jgi:23S rRNA (guanosine2251-2'-O)-methyltransferase
VGLSEDAELTYDKANLTGPIALVVGNEAKGISRLAREHCDVLIKLPMRGHVESLNAAMAGSVALYEIWRQRGWVMPSDPTSTPDTDSDLDADGEEDE